jgi:hypothetical protein
MYLASIERTLEKLRPLLSTDEHSTMTVLVFNFGQSELLLNFVCHVRRRSLDLRNVLVFATNTETAELAATAGLAAFYDEVNFAGLPRAAAAARYADRTFTKLLTAVLLIVLVGFVQSFSLSKLFAYKHVVYESVYPRTVVLGRLPDTSLYRNIKQYPEAEQYDGLLIVCIDGPLYFSNALTVRDKVHEYKRVAAKELEGNGNKADTGTSWTYRPFHTTRPLCMYWRICTLRASSVPCPELGCKAAARTSSGCSWPTSVLGGSSYSVMPLCFLRFVMRCASACYARHFPAVSFLYFAARVFVMMSSHIPF